MTDHRFEAGSHILWEWATGQSTDHEKRSLCPKRLGDT